MNDWLTVAQAAEYLSLGKQTIRRYVRDGRLEGSQAAPPTGKIRISAASVQKFLESNMIQAVDQ